MKFPPQWLNCLWLMLPLLIWNMVLGPHLTDPRITSDAHSPKWLLIAENMLRMLIFALPLLIPLRVESPVQKIGLVVYIAGTLIYFSSWLPLWLAPHAAWSDSGIGLLAPRITPLLPFLGVALIGASWPYGVITLLFISMHTWHGLQNLR